MNPISSGGVPYHTPSVPTRQEEEIKNALNLLIDASEEAASGGTISEKLFQDCKASLSTIVNDPSMPVNTRNEAENVLQEFENIPGQPNADTILNNIVQTVEKMQA